MNIKLNISSLVAVIGAGPAGLFAAKQLAENGARVILLNRDIKPGGLAEYGIFPSKTKMKEGLRKQFHQILDNPAIEYYGNVTVGQMGDISLSELKDMGFQALLVTVGAQGTKWLGMEGENLRGVYHAKDLVYHYNLLPPFSQNHYQIGKKLALIGVGNVMLDIAHWAIRYLMVDEVVALARRGPAEVKFTRKEMEIVACAMTLPDLDAEFERVAPVMRSLGQDVDAAKAFILSAMPKAPECISDTRFRFEFLSSPHRILGDKEGNVNCLEVENTTLVPNQGEPHAKRLGTYRSLDVDTVIFCIGDRVDEVFGLPVRHNAFVKNPAPRFPVNGLSFEAYDPEKGQPMEGIFVAGWSREASKGLVGIARKDGESGAQAVLQFLQTAPPLQNQESILQSLHDRLKQVGKPVVKKEDLCRLEEFERGEAERLGQEEYKLPTNEEMLRVMGFG